MADVTIIGTIPFFRGAGALEVRAYGNGFTLPAGEIVMAGSAYDLATINNFYQRADVTSTDSSLTFSIPLPPTTDSPTDAAQARWGLYIFAQDTQRSLGSVAGLESFWLEPTPGTTTAGALVARNKGVQPSVAHDANVAGTLTAGALSVSGDAQIAGPLEVAGAVTAADFRSRNDPLLGGLVAYWQLEEATGTRADSIGANHLTPTNNVTSVAGLLGLATHFVATDTGYLAVADNAALSMGAEQSFTLYGWVKHDTSTGTQPYLAKWAAGSTEYVVQAEGAAGGTRLYVSPDGTAYSFVAGPPPVVGQWAFVCAWHDAVANTINMQINNGAVYSASHSTGVFNGAAELRLGSNELGNSFMDGALDEWAVQKRVLTARERAALYNAGAGRRPGVISFSGGGAEVTQLLTSLDPRDFGAVGGNETLDTAAFQAALNRANELKIYKVRVPYSDPPFIVHDLIFPVGTDATGLRAITLEGDAPPPFTMQTLQSSLVPPDKGSILQMTRTTGFLLGGSTVRPEVVLRNLILRTPDNSSVTAVDGELFYGLTVEHMVIDTGRNTLAVVQPTNPSRGIVMPITGNGAHNYVRNLMVSGYNIGFLAGEHDDVSGLVVVGNAVGLLIGDSAFAQRFGRVLGQNNTLTVDFVTASFYGAGTITVVLEDLNIEHPTLGCTTPDTPAWQFPTADVRDTAGIGRGIINYHIPKACVGPDDTFTLIGGAHLRMQNLRHAGSVLSLAGGGVTWTKGSGSPEGVVTAPPGSLYSNTAGALYLKTSGTGATGWTLN